MTVAARSSSPLARAASARWSIGLEVALFLALTFLYEWLRQVVAPGDLAEPLRHAGQVIDAERALGLFFEPDLQRWVGSLPGGEPTVSWLYTVAHTAGFVAMFLFVWFFRRDRFAFFRNWFWSAHVAAVVGYALYPLAPPRLADIGLADPTKATLELGGGLSWFQPFRNEYAAMPSMHVGYTFLFALALFWMLGPSPWRWLAWLWPAGMLFVVMATANHFWLDGAGGVGVVLLALLAVHLVAGRQRRPWDRPDPSRSRPREERRAPRRVSGAR